MKSSDTAAAPIRPQLPSTAPCISPAMQRCAVRGTAHDGAMAIITAARRRHGVKPAPAATPHSLAEAGNLPTIQDLAGAIKQLRGELDGPPLRLTRAKHRSRAVQRPAPLAVIICSITRSDSTAPGDCGARNLMGLQVSAFSGTRSRSRLLRF